MANPDHVKELLKGVEHWNEWLYDQRKQNPSFCPDLSGFDIWSREAQESALFVAVKGQYRDTDGEYIDLNFWQLVPDLGGIWLAEADLSGAHLEWANLNWAHLEEAELTEAHLEWANLNWAHLERAGLLDAHLERADLSWAHLKGAGFEEAHLEGAQLNWAHLELAKLQGAHLEGSNLFWAYLEGARLSRAHLEGADLSMAHLERANLPRANLRDCDLSSADFTNANLTGVRYNGHSLLRSLVARVARCLKKLLTPSNLKKHWLGKNRLVRKTNASLFLHARRQGLRLWDLAHNPQSTYKGIRIENCHGNQRFRRFAMDQAYLEELRDSHLPWERLFYKFWLNSCDCGRSMLLWAFWSLLLAFSFGCIYWWMGEGAFHAAYLTSVPNPDDTGGPPGFWALQYYSIVTFTTLGFGDIVPKTGLAAFCVTLEVIFGYVMLGGLISIFANKLARRSG